MSLLRGAMAEHELLAAVTDALTFYKWRWHHVRRADRAQQMGHAGFPDICAARSGRVLFLELKSENGRLSVEQRAWLKAIKPDYWAVVRPSDLDWFLRDIE